MDAGEQHVCAALQRAAGVFPQTLPDTYRIDERLQDAGVRLLVGTDTPAPCVMPGFSVPEELAELVNAGLTPYQALRAATANAGEFLGDDSGKLVVGGRADLVLLRANPLDDIRNVSKVAGVVLNGRWLSRDYLDRMIAKDARSSVQ